ncbi:MAG: hypothetical protein C5B43_02340 [Verrucomicrobia bacterium]|nr:MAG: hypothetical protein C5B43_02340 [Verrucomicrobiota bacterium]
MKKILFTYDHPRPESLKGDGLWCALDLLEKDFEITRLNLSGKDKWEFDPNFDFYLGWGGFDSKVDKYMQSVTDKKGLCLAAQMPVNETAKNYDVIFYETEEIRKWLEVSGLKNLVHAFGINTDIFYERSYDNFPEDENAHKIWDTISVGSFSPWHRQDLLYDREPGIAVGRVDSDNIQQSFNYVANLLLKGWTISNEVPQEKLAQLYNMSRKFIATADFGQERAVLEARACGIEVEVPADNPKLKELLTSLIWDVKYYSNALKGGILKCLSEENA